MSNQVVGKRSVGFRVMRLVRAGAGVNLLCGLFVLSVLLVAGVPARAANIWDGAGGTNGNWSSAANWDNDAVPVFPTNLTFAGSTQLASTNDLSGLIVNGFTFNAAGGVFTLRGNDITLGGNVGFSANPAATVTQTIELKMALTGERTLTSTARGHLALGGILSGAGSLLSAGAGTNTVSGANTFTGGVTLESGTLKATTAAGALGTGASTLRLNGGTLHLANGSSLSFNRNTVVSNDVTLVPDSLTAAGADRTMTLGTLSVGSKTVSVVKGPAITGTSVGQITFGATTLTGDPLFSLAGYSQLQLGNVGESTPGLKLSVRGSGTNPLMILGGIGTWTGGTELHVGSFLRGNVANSLGAVGSAVNIHGGILDLRHASAGTGRDLNVVSNAQVNMRFAADATADFRALTLAENKALTFSVDRAGTTATGFTLTLNAPLTTAGNGTLNVVGGNSYKAVMNNTLTLGGTLTVSPSSAPLTISGAISDGAESFGLVKTGTGLLTLTGPNDYDGGTTVSAGRLLIGARQAAPHDRPLLVDGGTYDMGGLSLTNSAVTMLAGTLTNGTLTAPSYLLAHGLVAGDATLAGSGSLTNAGGIVTVLGGMTYEGNTVIEGGVLSIATTAQLPGWDTAGRYSVAADAGLAVGNAVTDGNVATILGTGNFAAGAGFGFDTYDGDRTYAATLADTAAGALGLVKVGPNVLTLASGNTYSGGTAVLGGTLYVPADSALGAAGGGLMISNNAALQFGGDMTLNNRQVLVRSGGYLVGDAGRTLTITNDLALLSGNLTITGACTVALGGSNTYSGHVYVNNSKLSFLPGSTNVILGMDLRPAGVAGTTGSVHQTGGYVSIVGGQAGLCIGNNGGVGDYTLDGGGTLRALTTGNRGILLGVNHFSTGTFHLVSGVVTGNQLQVSRSDSGGTNSAGFYYQRSGSSQFSSLYLAGGTAANSANCYALLAISNGTFSAASFGGLSGGNNSTSVLYFGNGTQVTLGAFPTARGTSAYSGLTFDGGTLSPIAASTTYMSNLTKTYITDNGATFDVPAGKNITVAQLLENAPGATSGGLTKAGNGVLTLSGTNTFGGNTAVNAGVLSLATTGALPGWNVGGRFSVAGSAALYVGNAVIDASVAALLGTGNFAAGSSFGFDTSAGNRTYASALADWSGGPMGLVKVGANTLTLTATNTYTGWTIVYGNNGTGLELNSPSGPALLGSLQIGAVGDTANNVYVKTLAPNQFGPASLLFLNRGTGVNCTPVFELLGNNQTVAGLYNDLAGGGATWVENTQTEVGYGSAILTVSNSADYAYTSNIRDRSSGASGNLGFTKDGPARQTLSGSGIVFTGPCLVKNGTLILSNTTAFAVAPTITGGQLLLASSTALNSKSVTNLAANGLGFMAGNAFTIGGLVGSGTCALTNDYGDPVTLTLGAGNANGDCSGALSGSGSVVKSGTGAQALSGESTFTGDFVLGNATSNISTSSVATAGSGGFVIVGHNQALGAGTVVSKGAQVWASVAGLKITNSLNVTSSGGFRFGGANDLEFSGSAVVDGIRGFGNYSLNRTLTFSGVELALSTGSTISFEAQNGAATNGAIAVSAAITGDGLLTVDDSYDNGTVVLSGVNTYTGETAIKAGTLALTGSGSITQSPLIAVWGSATLDVSGRSSTYELATGQTLRGTGTVVGNASLSGAVRPADAGTIGTLTMNGNVDFQPGATATFDLGTLTGVGGTTNDLLVVNGDLGAAGTLQINVTEPLDTAGTYCLIKYTGARTGTFSVTVLNGRYTPTLNYDTPGQVNVTFAASATTSLTWKGTAGYATWDQGTSTNWSDGSSTWTSFFALDDVTFDGTADDNTAQLVDPVSPTSVTVSGGNDVAITGAGKITGIATLAKSGAGTLTISTANDFTGETTVSGGKVRVGSNTALGAGGLTLGDGTALSCADSTTARTLSTPYALAGDVTLGDATDSAALTLSGTNALTASRTLTVPSAVTLSGVISQSGGSFGLTKKGAGNLTLNKANTFTGSSTVEEGTLTVAAVVEPATTLDLPLLTVKSGATAVLSGAGSSLGDSMDVAVEAGGRLDSQKNDIMGGLSGAGQLRGTHASTVFTTTVNNGNETTEFSGDITYTSVPLSIAKNGTGTLTLSGVNSHRATTVNNGMLRIASATALPYGTPLTLGDSAANTAGILDLTSYSATVGSLNVSSTNGFATNRIFIAAGQLLSVTGNVTIGFNVNTARTAFVAQGGGSMQVVNSGGTFNMGLSASGTDKRCLASADFSGLSGFAADLGSGSLTIGFSGDNGNWGNYVHTLTLATSNLVRAATVQVGGSALGSPHQLRLGPATNVFLVNNLNLGALNRDCGYLLFASGSGSLTLRDLSGAGRANVTMGSNTVSTGYPATNLFDMAGHPVDLRINTLRMGQYTTRTAAWRNTFSFDRGLLDISSVLMSVTNSGTINAISTLSLGGGVANIGSMMLSSSTATGVVNVTGGTVTLGGDIFKQPNGRAILSLSGGTLDLQGHSIGSASAKIDVVSFTGGTLANLAGFNGVDPLVKTGTGTLEIAGSNTYTSTNRVTAGTLLVNGTLAAASHVIVTNAALGGVGSIGGSVAMQSRSRLLTGGTNTTANILSVGGDFTLAAGVTNFMNCVASTNSYVAVAGALSLQGANVIHLTHAGVTPPRQVTVFTFGSLSGEENLGAWKVGGVNQGIYNSRILRDGSRIIVVTSMRGLLLRVF